MKHLPVLISLIYLIGFFTPVLVHAETRSIKIINNINVSAQVPGFNLYVSGLFSPDSSVVLYNKRFLSGLGAFKTDENGYFNFKIGLGYIEPVELCISGVAIDNLDSRPYCFEIDLKKSNYYIKDIYLSPTIKLLNSEKKSEFKVRGYTMPGASVIVLLDKNVYTNIKSDRMGFYESLIEPSTNKDHELYVYAVGSSFVTIESRYVYFASEGSELSFSQNYIFVDSLYTVINDKFIYIFIFLALVLLIILLVVFKSKVRRLYYLAVQKKLLNKENTL